MILVDGPAGTGKITVQMIVVWFFWRLGYHIVYDAATNPNVEDGLKRLRFGFPDVEALRIAPISTESDLQEMSTGESDALPSLESFQDQMVFENLKSKVKNCHKKYESSAHIQTESVACKDARKGNLNWKFD